MNRHERRRRAKLGDIVEIKLGRVVFDIKPGDDVSRDICFVCGKPATAWLIPEGRAGPIPEGSMAHSFAEINAQQTVLLCEVCFNTEDQNRRRDHSQVLERTGFKNLRWRRERRR